MINLKIILHSNDINLLIYWEKCIKNIHSTIDTLEELLSVKDSIVIVNYSAFGPKIKSYLYQLNQNNNRVLVLHRTPDIETAKLVLSNGAMGYGNAMMRDHFIVSAIKTIRDDMIWLYPKFTSMLIAEIPEKNDEDRVSSLMKELTKREKSVALLLKDGYTYKEIADKFNITARTVKAHASHIYEKLQVKDKIALALLLK